MVIVAGVTLGKVIKEPLNKLTEMTSSADQALTQTKATPLLPPIALPRSGVLEDYSKAASTNKTLGRVKIYSAPSEESEESGLWSECPEEKNKVLLKQHYFVRVSDWKSNQMVLTAFIRGGDKIELKLPAGSFRIRYATGSEWYGEKHLFGEDTRYVQLMNKDITNQPLKVELTQQPLWNIALFPCGTEGTMREEPIDPDNF
ncbi:MAG: hypothetical protein KME10_22075 [Plectolyngbya sp. WJT66-NPBG17]|nr:hypothetical protein [Plectolyngbya sp. WJT66-NPBG17]